MSLSVSILSFLLLEPTAASDEIAAPAPPCSVVLSRLFDSATSLGYFVGMDGRALSGTKGTARFKARCVDRHVAPPRRR